MVPIAMMILLLLPSLQVSGVRRIAKEKGLNGELLAPDNSGITYNAAWFDNHCVADSSRPDFDADQYQLSRRKEDDDKKWTDFQKCEPRKVERPGDKIIEEIEDMYVCAKECSKASQLHADELVCCEYGVDKKRCEIRMGGLSEQQSDWAKKGWKPKQWKNVLPGRHSKKSRLFYTVSGTSGVVPASLADVEEIRRAEIGENEMEGIAEQVQHMSIEGIIDHLLSFYVCMRWVPDANFIELVEFELANVAAKFGNGSTESASSKRKDLLEKFLNGDLMPLRCGTALHVQSLVAMDNLAESLTHPESDLNDAADFSKQVMAKKTLLDNMKTRIEAVNTAMRYDAEEPGDSNFVKEFNLKVRKELPWETFLRPSEKYKKMDPSENPEDMFMLCFGPRVVSYPHKRENGVHILADMNMAGCNGFWNAKTMIEHIGVIKKLFSPEQCFEEKLRTQLKKQFMATFMEMNAEFEQAIQGRFTRRLSDLDPKKSLEGQDVLLTATSDDGSAFGKKVTEMAGKVVAKVTEVKDKVTTTQKYKDFAGMVAGAHAKWAICKAGQNIGQQAFGTEDNVYSDPKAYEKWIGKVDDDSVPECKTLDQATGCVKCVVKVKSEHSCPVRLEVTLDGIFSAMEGKKYPFLKTEYHTEEKKSTEQANGTVVEGTETKKEEGFCLVRKKDSNDLTFEKIDGRKVQDTDEIVLVKNSAQTVQSVERYTVHTRLEERRMYDDASLSPQTNNNYNTMALVPDRGTYKPVGGASYDNNAQSFGKWFIFTDTISTASNTPVHMVDYFVSCPCNPYDFGPSKHFEVSTSQGMSEYWNR